MSRPPEAARRLVVVHAHPDDECITTGGLLARYAAEGAHVCLVTCTAGELGEIAEIPGLQPESIRPRLAEVRADELRRACDVLGVSDVRLLGYRDSGMAGTPTTADPRAFVNQDLHEVAARIDAVLRDVRPQVVVTYDAKGLYGHPDHIRAHDATVAAFDAAAEEAHLESGERPRLFYAVAARSVIQRGRELLEATGHPAANGTVFSEDTIRTVATPDDEIEVRLDVSGFIPRKIEALRAHRTQWGTTRELVELPEDVRTLLLGTEFFVLARGSAPRDAELFTGLRP